MSKVDLDYASIKSGAILNLNDSINILQDTIKYFNYFDIPYNFSKKGQLLDVERKLMNIKKELSDIKSWIINSNNNYDTLLKNLQTQANKLPTYSVKKRNNII